MDASGAAAGTTGTRPCVPRLAYVGLAFFIFVSMTVSALTVKHDAGLRLHAWRPFVAEYTAAVMLVAAMPVVAYLTVRTPFERGHRLRFALVHFLGSLVFCGLVVGGFVVLRKLVAASLGQHYVFGSPGDLIYEYRKATLAYCGMAVIFYLSAQRGAAARPQPEAAPIWTDPTFDIHDGARVIRTPIKEITAARSAGNYVEFHLPDGHRPLMRTTLADIEAALQPHGFARTHRSWLVNTLRLRVLEPDRSGDWRIQLDDGTEAPLSRRYPAALDALRRPMAQKPK